LRLLDRTRVLCYLCLFRIARPVRHRYAGRKNLSELTNLLTYLDPATQRVSGLGTSLKSIPCVDMIRSQPSYKPHCFLIRLFSGRCHTPTAYMASDHHTAISTVKYPNDRHSTMISSPVDTYQDLAQGNQV